jgi:hypothetical protein
VREIPRILASLGASVAPVGLVIYAMGIAYRERRDADVTLGIWLMVIGLLALVVGLAWLYFAPDDARTDAPH